MPSSKHNWLIRVFVVTTAATTVGTLVATGTVAVLSHLVVSWH